MISKDRLLSIAEVIDAFRVVPRVLLFGYCWFGYYVVSTLLDWYMALPVSERGLEAGGFAAGVITAVTGLATAFMNIYHKSGRSWDNKNKTS